MERLKKLSVLRSCGKYWEPWLFVLANDYSIKTCTWIPVHCLDCHHCTCIRILPLTHWPLGHVTEIHVEVILHG